MDMIEFIIFLSLSISYGVLIINLIKGHYKNKAKNLFIDIWVAYFLAPLIAIALIWEFVEKKVKGRF